MDADENAPQGNAPHNRSQVLLAAHRGWKAYEEECSRRAVVAQQELERAVSMLIDETVQDAAPRPRGRCDGTAVVAISTDSAPSKVVRFATAPADRCQIPVRPSDAGGLRCALSLRSTPVNSEVVPARSQLRLNAPELAYASVVVVEDDEVDGNDVDTPMVSQEIRHAHNTAFVGTVQGVEDSPICTFVPARFPAFRRGPIVPPNTPAAQGPRPSRRPNDEPIEPAARRAPRTSAQRLNVEAGSGASLASVASGDARTPLHDETEAGFLATPVHHRPRKASQTSVARRTVADEDASPGGRQTACLLQELLQELRLSNGTGSSSSSSPIAMPL